MNPENQIRSAHLMSVLNLRRLHKFCLFAFSALSVCIGSLPVVAQLIIGPPIKVYPTTPQRGGDVAASPLDPNVVFVGAIDTSQAGRPIPNFAVSNDGGQTFSTSFMPLSLDGRPQTSDGVWDGAFTTSIAVDSQGNLYSAIGTQNQSNTANGVYVATISTPPTVDPSNIIPVANNPANSGIFDDPFPSVAVDPNTGLLYVAFQAVNFNASPPHRIVISASTDGGKTFSPPQVVATGDPFGAVGGAQVAAQNGRVYVTYAKQCFNISPTCLQANVTTSNDGGMTWSNPVVTAQYSDLNFPTTYYKDAFPRSAIDISDPTANTFYVSYLNQTLSGVEIRVAKSTDGGQTFPLNNNVRDTPSGHAVFPEIRLASDGKLYVVWMENRFSGNDNMLDVVISYSTNGGVTFSQNQRQTQNSIDVTGETLILSHIGVAVIGPIIVDWSDPRTTGTVVATDTLPQ